MLAVGDGNLGFWAALREVYPEMQEQRCWKHKLANVLDKLPKRLQARAKEILREMMYAPDRKSALEELDRFSEEYGARYPKAVETLTKDQERLLTSLTFLLNTGFTCKQLIRSNRRFQPSRHEPRKPKVLAHERPGRRWHSSCSWLLRNDDAKSMLLTSLRGLGWCRVSRRRGQGVPVRAST